MFSHLMHTVILRRGSYYPFYKGETEAQRGYLLKHRQLINSKAGIWEYARFPQDTKSFDSISNLFILI